MEVIFGTYSRVGLITPDTQVLKIPRYQIIDDRKSLANCRKNVFSTRYYSICLHVWRCYKCLTVTQMGKYFYVLADPPSKKGVAG